MSMKKNSYYFENATQLISNTLNESFEEPNFISEAETCVKKLPINQIRL